MQIALSELQANVDKYVGIAETTDVIITKHGKPTAKIIRFAKEPWHYKNVPERITSIEELFGTLPNDITLEDIKSERLHK